MRLQSVRTRARLVAPLRIAIAAVWLGVSVAAGARTGVAFAAFAVGVVGIAFLALNDPRARFTGREPQPLPAGANVVVDPAWRQALSSLFPSTVGLSALAAIAVAPLPVLTALLAGAVAGLGVAAAASLPRIDAELLVDPRRGTLYRP